MTLCGEVGEEVLAQHAAYLAHELIPVLSPVIAKMKTGKIGEQTRLLHQYQDEMSAALKAVLACRSGCDYCCHYRVLVTPADVFAVIDHIEQLPLTQRALVQGRVIETAKKVSSMTPGEHQNANIACAFLHQRQCLIYPVRPLPCRGHHSLDERVCAHAFTQPELIPAAPRDLKRVAVSDAVSYVQVHVSREVGLDVTRYELHAALAEAMTNKATAKRWRNGKKAFPNVKDQEPA